MKEVKNKFSIKDSLIVTGDNNTSVFKAEKANVNSTKNANNAITINLHDCIVYLPAFQGELVNLANDLKKAGHTDDAEYINEVAEAAGEMQNSIKNDSANGDAEETLTKKGILSKLKGFYEDLIDENSELHKNTVKLRNGLKKIQSLLKLYNNVAKVIPVLPKVPDAILKAGE